MSWEIEEGRMFLTANLTHKRMNLAIKSSKERAAPAIVKEGIRQEILKRDVHWRNGRIKRERYSVVW